MSHRLCAILEFDTGALRELLQLPETAEIVDARMEFGARGRLQLKIEGAGYPTREGQHVPPCTCIVRSLRDADGDIELNPVLNWPFNQVTGMQEES